MYDKVGWTIAEVTTSDVFLFLCSKGDLAVVRLLLGFKANLDCADNDGWTPLHRACKYVPGADYYGMYSVFPSSCNIRLQEREPCLVTTAY